MDTGANKPFEFIMAAVNARGELVQYCGVDQEIAEEIAAVCAEGKALSMQQAHRDRIEEIRLAGERGDTPPMPRHTVTKEDLGERHARAPLAPGMEDKPTVGGAVHIGEEIVEDDDESAE